MNTSPTPLKGGVYRNEVSIQKNNLTDCGLSTMDYGLNYSNLSKSITKFWAKAHNINIFSPTSLRGVAIDDFENN